MRIPIGRGGNAEVYKSFEPDSKAECAVKVAKKGRIYREQFENEKRVLGYLTQKGYRYAPSLYAQSENEMFMELISGDTLEKAPKHRFSEVELKALFIKICEMIYELHELNPPVIHRDIKPSNMMLDKVGNVKMIDFGTAKILGDYSVVPEHDSNEMTHAGTKGYAAPEQYGGFDEGLRTDVYQLGQSLKRILSKADTSKAFEESMMKIIDRCCSPGIDERYISVNDIKLDLIGISARSKGIFFRKRKMCITVCNKKKAKKLKENRIFIDIVRTCDSIEFL